MGEQGAFKLPQAKSEEPGEADKLAEFGRNLFKQGKSLAESVQSKADKIDVSEIASKAREKLKSIDTDGLKSKASKALNNVDAEKIAASAGIASRLAFPQLTFLERGSSELGDLIARKQAKALLDDPKKLSDKMIASFDEIDRDKSGHLNDAKLQNFDGIKGVASDNRALSLILRSGYSSFNSLDGDSSDRGISRLDVQTFALMQNKDLLNDYVSKVSTENAITWGLAGAGAGSAFAYLKHAGLDFSQAAFKSLPMAKVALAATAAAFVVGGSAKLISRYRQDCFYDEKGKELNSLIGSMKNSF